MSIQTIKRIVAVFGIGIAVLAIVFGSYMPLVKARRYISAFRDMQNIKSTADYKATFDTALNFYSPIGDEEVAKFMTYDILNVIGNPQQSEEVMRDLVTYIEPHLFKNNVRHLLGLAQMYETIWKRFKKEEDFLRAEEYYLKAREIGPRLPPVLYGLLYLYYGHQNILKIREMCDRILPLWPSDENMQKLCASLPIPAPVTASN